MEGGASIRVLLNHETVSEQNISINYHMVHFSQY